MTVLFVDCRFVQAQNKFQDESLGQFSSSLWFDESTVANCGDLTNGRFAMEESTSGLW